MKKIKIRGHRKKQKQIQKWIDIESKLNFEFLDKYKYCYSDIYIHPWCDISLINSEFPEPKGKTRNDLILGLEKIYNNWKIELEKLNKPYYLKIWLYEPRVSKSQVVCAIDERINYYSNFFLELLDNEKPSDFCNKLNPNLRWNLYEDSQTWSENFLLKTTDNEDYNCFCLKKIKSLKQKKYKTEIINIEDGKDKLYFEPKGKIWVNAN